MEKKEKKKKTQRRDLASLFTPVKHSSRNIAHLLNNNKCNHSKNYDLYRKRF